MERLRTSVFKLLVSLRNVVKFKKLKRVIWIAILWYGRYLLEKRSHRQTQLKPSNPSHRCTTPKWPSCHQLTICWVEGKWWPLVKVEERLQANCKQTSLSVRCWLTDSPDNGQFQDGELHPVYLGSVKPCVVKDTNCASSSRSYHQGNRWCQMWTIWARKSIHQKNTKDLLSKAFLNVEVKLDMIKEQKISNSFNLLVPARGLIGYSPESSCQ